MRARFVVFLLALMVFVFGSSSVYAMEMVVQGDSLVGRVFSSATHRGLPGYQVQLSAPLAAKIPVRVAITDADGRYRFRHVWKGRSLLEVYWGLTLVSRQVIDTSRPGEKVVALAPVTRARLAQLQPSSATYKPAATGP